jgi:dUTP pyrophosphatase
MSIELRVSVKRIRSDPAPLPFPRYMTADAAGMDVYADVDEEVIVPPLGRVLIPSGFALAVPKGYEAQVRPRSGLALRAGLTLLNTPGTIDADYRDEVQILVINLGDQPVHIQRGDRIAQLIVAPVVRVHWQEVEQLESTERGGGFGHTGVWKSGRDEG